jgi:predicted Zn-dependent protease
MDPMKRRGLLAAAAVIALAACQAPGTGTPTPGPSTSPSAARQLAAADARLFSGDYEGAEQDYQALAKAGVRGATSHYATLLDYEARFREAIAQASAGVDEHADSSSLARLIRAYDWANDVDRAVATGQRAVSAKPVDPLARIYFSEALADAGRYGEAQAQLRLAEKMNPGDAYGRSELYREWANYYRDRADEQAELNNIELSLKMQPGFPERSLELARHQYLAKRLDQAHAAIAQATKGSHSAAVLQGAGDAEVLAGEIGAATQHYQAAAQAAPGAPAPALALAELAVAGKRDFKGAHDSLVPVLKANPTRSDVYQFLWNLDTYVLKIDADRDLAPTAATPPGDLAAARSEAMAAVNDARKTAGLGPLSEDSALDRASQAHAWYTFFNLGDPSLSGLGVHQETQNLPGFVAASPIARDVAAGYKGTRGSEVINHVYTPKAAVEVWVDSVYHRFPLVDNEAETAGYGEAQIGTITVSVMDVGLGVAAKGSPVVFPADGQRDVPAAFVGNEVPDPAPEGTSYPVGYPITLITGSASNLAISSAQLTGPKGDVTAFLLQPGQQVDTGEASLLPQQPLTPGATYTVQFTGTLDGQPLSKRWTFTVAPPA